MLRKSISVPDYSPLTSRAQGRKSVSKKVELLWSAEGFYDSLKFPFLRSKAMTLCLRGIKKQLYVYIMEYNSAIKKNEIMPFAVTWMDLKIIKRREVRERQI